MGYEKIAAVLIPAKHKVVFGLQANAGGIRQLLSKVPDRASLVEILKYSDKEFVLTFDEAKLEPPKPRRKRKDVGIARGSRPDGRMRAAKDAEKPQGDGTTGETDANKLPQTITQAADANNSQQGAQQGAGMASEGPGVDIPRQETGQERQYRAQGFDDDTRESGSNP